MGAGHSYGKVSYCFWEICSKNLGLQENTLSGPRMTTGFAPFELLTPERAEPLPSFKEPSSLLAFTVVYMNIQITKQIGGGAQWVELSTEGMGEPTYGLSLSSRLVKVGAKIEY